MNDFFKIADKYLKPVTIGAGVVLGLAVTYAGGSYLYHGFLSVDIQCDVACLLEGCITQIKPILIQYIISDR